MAQLPVAIGNPLRADLVDRRNLDMSDHLKAVLTRRGIQAKEVADWWGCSPQFASEVLANGKALNDRHIEQLPADIQQELAQEWCASLGLLVGPAAAAAEAVIGLARVCGCLSLPAKADAMAQATIDVQPQTTRRRA